MAGYLVVTGSYLGDVHLHSILRVFYIQQYIVTVHIYTLRVMLLCIITYLQGTQPVDLTILTSLESIGEK